MTRPATITSLASVALLIASAVGLQSDPPPAQEETKQAEETTETTDNPTRELTVEDIIRDLTEESGTRADYVRPSQPPAAVKPVPGASRLPVWIKSEDGSRKPKLLLEGSWIIGRRGRLIRSDISGEWLFMFESDADERPEPPMVLMPCMALQSMERHAEERGDAAQFIVNGEVFVYHDRNYLLPTWYLLEARIENGLEPTQ